MGFDEPETIDITSLNDSCVRRVIIDKSPYTITYGGSTAEALTYYPPSTTGWSSGPYRTEIPAEDLSKVFSWEEMMKKLGKEEEGKVNVISRKSADSREHIVYCEDMLDLSVERVLTTLSAVKGRLMFEIAPIHIREIQCKMTPTVKKHILEASKKLKMYGKKTPIIPSFDEYGNRLPDEIEIGDSKGILVQIVEPEKYGEVYFELKAIEFDSVMYNPNGWNTGTWTAMGGDLPF